jgi:hypothetical protein
MEIKNINNKPDIKFLESDEQFLVELKNGKDVIHIGHPKKDEYDEYYPMYVNGQEILGTGTDSLGQAILWGESYLTRNKDPNEMFWDHIRDISRAACFLECVLAERVKKD